MKLSFAEKLENIMRCIVREEVKLLLIKSDECKKIDNIFTVNINKKVASNKIGWLSGNSVLQKFHTLLNSYGYLSCSFETFQSHFSENEISSEKLIWHSNINRLVYLFNQLAVLKHIPEPLHPHGILTIHFLNKNGGELKPNSLRSSLEQIRNSRMNEVKEIITELGNLRKL